MTVSYPNTRGFAYGFERGELTIDRRIFTGISNVSIDQPTTEGVVMGTSPYPLARTPGVMEIGQGGITFSDLAQLAELIDYLGDGWRERIFEVNWILSAVSRPKVKIAAQSCRALANPFDHAQGGDALGGELPFSFLSHTVNGKSPHPR